MTSNHYPPPSAYYASELSTSSLRAESPSLLDRCLGLLPGWVQTSGYSAHVTRVLQYADRGDYKRRWTGNARSRRERRSNRPSSARRAVSHLLSVPVLLTLAWLLVLWHGERQSFRDHIGRCDWEKWENWHHARPSDAGDDHAAGSAASPHRLIFVADPQLVDPHTYPGRPWPLSSLTIYYTDLYLRRSFSLLQGVLAPHTIIFLGDLFDGGREWSTGSTKSPEQRWRRYGETFWLREYERFGRIFLQKPVSASSRCPKTTGDVYGSCRAAPRIIATLPGNHDLGLGSDIQLPVRDRFNAFFGEGNRVDVIGNHTFVSVDTVSLSAKDAGLGQPPAQAAGNVNDGNENVWRPAQDFLNDLKGKMAQAAAREVRFLSGATRGVEAGDKERYRHEIGIPGDRQPQLHARGEVTGHSTNFPTIVLTHIPLYRDAGTKCGPLRERWPPSETTDDGGSDERNAIKIQKGYRYQNVLTPSLSQEIVDKAGGVGGGRNGVVYAFSGDDHDHCDVAHTRYSHSTGEGQAGTAKATAKIREITVKSISWAMGVRRPGFVMASLWNPIGLDGEGQQVSSDGGAAAAAAAAEGARQTIQTHLCLLPDQLGIFVRYAWLFVVTVVALGARAVVRTVSASRARAAFKQRREQGSHDDRDLSQEESDAESRAGQERAGQEKTTVDKCYPSQQQHQRAAPPSHRFSRGGEPGAKAPFGLPVAVGAPLPGLGPDRSNGHHHVISLVSGSSSRTSADVEKSQRQHRRNTISSGHSRTRQPGHNHNRHDHSQVNGGGGGGGGGATMQPAPTTDGHGHGIDSPSSSSSPTSPTSSSSSSSSGQHECDGKGKRRSRMIHSQKGLLSYLSFDAELGRPLAMSSSSSSSTSVPLPLWNPVSGGTYAGGTRTGGTYAGTGTATFTPMTSLEGAPAKMAFVLEDMIPTASKIVIVVGVWYLFLLCSS